MSEAAFPPSDSLATFTLIEGTDMTTPDWLVPGAPVVILQPYDSAALRAAGTTVARVLARDIVLDNGERFNKATLRRRIGGTWGYSELLVHVDDPRVEETRKAIRVRNRRAWAIRTFENWRKDKATAADVIAAFKALESSE